jgi:hypothetical protein
VRAMATVGMVSGYCVPFYMNDKLNIPFIVSGILWYYVISVITMEYIISYREVCYLVNRSWHTVCSAL